MRTMAIYLWLLIFLFWPSIKFGQDTMPEPQMNVPPGPGPPPPGLVVPIDSNIIVLIIVGLILGIFMVMKFRRNFS